MIQDIYPDRLNNVFREAQPKPEDFLLHFNAEGMAVKYEKNRLVFPAASDYPEKTEARYLFSVSGREFFLAGNPPVGTWPRCSMRELRELKLSGNADIFEAYTAYHLWQWYSTSVFCGACGGRTVFDQRERAKVCPECGNRIYPRINPAVIVGVKNGERLLLTRYREGFRHNALIAGFCEIGETAEETVRREVMEEVGLKVCHIRYYKSQPWGIASDLLMGFYCEVDGDDTIHRDENELKYADWIPREEIVLQPSDYSLTNEMMKRFRDGEERGSRGPKGRTARDQPALPGICCK